MASAKQALSQFMVVLTLSVRAAAGAPPDSAPAVLADVQATEWVILVGDPFQNRASPAATVASTLPDWIDSLRPAAPSEKRGQPCPIGLIRFSGNTDRPFTVRLTAPPRSTICAAWPPARIHLQELLWRDLTLSAQPRILISMEPTHWLTPLRSAARPYFTSAGESEKFLLYDVEFPFPMPLAIERSGSAGSVLIENSGKAPLHDLVIYCPPRGRKTWSVGGLSDVLPTPPRTPTTGSRELATIRLAPAAGEPAEFLLADWKQRLAAWELDAVDLDLIVRQIKSLAFDDQQMTAVFRLDEAELERFLRLDITPRPARVRRLALVIARNIDPDLPQVITRLVAQLGDSDWHKREAASERLAACGPAAVPGLRTALQNPDPEIVLRAERLLGPAAFR